MPNGARQELIHNLESLIQQSLNEVKVSEACTYSRGVDAQFSGQHEEGSSQYVDVHLWRRAMI